MALRCKRVYRTGPVLYLVPDAKPLNLRNLGAALGMLLYSSSLLYAAEGPYFVTYTHQLEEQGNLDIENRSVLGRPTGGNGFLGSATEFEYGLLG